MAAGDLTDILTVKTWLGIGQPDTSQDAQLDQLITAASALIGAYLQRNLLSASYTELYQGNGQDFMMLRQAPVTAVSSVLWSGTTIPAGNPLNLSSGYYMDADARTLRLVGYRFPWKIPLQVIYTAGYAAVPTDVAQACVELVGSAFNRPKHIDQTTKNLGGQETVAFSQADMNATVKTMLQPYRFLSPLV